MALARVLCPTLIGRETELSALEDALLAALRGDGGVVIVGGEAGMGKTRLVGELSARAQRLRCAVMSGACSEAELSLPYLPFLEAIGNRLTIENMDELRERLGAAADELAQLFPQLGRPSAAGGDATQAKLRMFEAILLLLRDAARDRALLLILEDLQWADPGTRELLDYMTRRLRSTNVLVLATYRMDEMHRKHPLVPTIQGWRRSGQAQFIELQSLPPAAVADMVCAIFAERDVSEEFRDFLHERSEGNPFVLEEMLRDAVDRGDIYRTDSGWDRKALAEIRIPRNVRDTILHRLERLDRKDVAVLSAASVMGRSIDLKSLSAVAGVDEEAVLSALEASISAQLLEEEDRNSGRYRFRHALTREAIYEDMVVPRRQQLHARVADVLASRPDRVAVDLANHLLMAGRYDEAVGMCVTAADDAIRALAFRDAAELLERAAPYVPDPTERARMLCRAADSYWNNNESASSKRLLEPAIAELEAAGLDTEAAGQRVLLGRCFWELLRSDLAKEQFELARQVLEPAGPSEALAILYIRLAGMAQFDEELVSGLEYSRRAADIAERVGADLAKAWSWNFMAGCEIGLGQVETGYAHMEDSYQAALAGGHRFQVGNAVYNALHCALRLGAGDKVAVWFDRIGSSDTDPWPPYLSALVALERGRVVDGIALARIGVQRSRDSGHQKMVWRSAVGLAHALAENMAGDEAASVLPPVSSRVDVQDAAYDGAPRIRIKLAAGDAAGAFETAKTIPPNACYMGAPIDAIAEVAGDPVWLRSLIDSLPLPGEVLASPRVAAANGRLALLEGRWSDALDDLHAADAGFRRGGLLLDSWHLGRALAEAEFRSGDVEAAGRRLAAIVEEAAPAGALLAARLARDTAVALGLEVAAAPDPVVPSGDSDRVATGERMVSVLFTDVRGYTEMSGSNPPAEMAERIATLQRWASQEVARRHGRVDKFAGDAVMATFNISGESVDHTLQALQAAIAIIDKASLIDLPVGAGVAVGPAVVGRLTEAGNVSVLGEVTNLAARLQSQSAAGEVTLSAEAHRRVEGWLAERGTAVERVELQLKGFGAPVIAFRVRASAGAGNRA
jgi:class 3 adenylate cyclase/tetratricopeptide (TPR) repeat protein